MSKKIALFGGAFNPPHLSHRSVVEALIPHFDEIIVLPCGPRPDKPPTGDIEPIHRAVMCDMTFRGLPKVRVDLSDLEQATFTRHFDIERRLRFTADPWMVVGADLIKGGKEGKSQIHGWLNGDLLWRSANFAVSARLGHDFDRADLPPRHALFEPGRGGSSSEIRDKCGRRESVDDLVVPEVAAYMKRYNLYRPTSPKATRLQLEAPRPLVIPNAGNERAAKIAEAFAPVAVTERPNCIVVIGGDGHMLHMIREHWRMRLPFIGVNAGHRGYMLNDQSDIDGPEALRDLIVHQMPLLHVLYQKVGDSAGPREDLAFNDAWVKDIDQTPWMEVKIDGKVKFAKLVGDGLLVSTAAGSTAYARSMGAKPLRLDTQEMLLVGDNIDWSHHWRSAPISLSSVVEIRPIDPQKRPIQFCYDDRYGRRTIGEVSSVCIRASRIAAVELAFSPNLDLEAKREKDFFPPA